MCQCFTDCNLLKSCDPLDGPTPGVLFEVDVPIMSNTECHDMFKKAGHEKRILDSFVCAGYAEGKKDSCEVMIPPFANFPIAKCPDRPSMIYLHF